LGFVSVFADCPCAAFAVKELPSSPRGSDGFASLTQFCRLEVKKGGLIYGNGISGAAVDAK
jgi:hypothetical protein